ncbi:hypothetical protein ACF5W4_11050 [Bacillota bacterium Lsc_1132]
MSYNKTQWLDHVTDPTTGAIVQQGTPVSAGNLNNLENGVYETRETVTALAQEVLQAERDIRDNKAEIGTFTLTNSQEYPFNNSLKTVALVEDRNKITDYSVALEVVSADGPVGDLIVSGKLVNGFKAQFTGSAKNVTLKYYLRGGIR